MFTTKAGISLSRGALQTTGILTADEKITTWRDPDNPNRDPDARPTICEDDANVHPYESAVDVNMPQQPDKKKDLPRTNTLAPDDDQVHAFQESEDVDKKVEPAAAAAAEAASEAEAEAAPAAAESEGPKRADDGAKTDEERAALQAQALKKGESVSILSEAEKTTTWKPESDSDEDSDDAEQRAMMRMMQTVAPDDRNVHEFSESADVDSLGI